MLDVLALDKRLEVRKSGEDIWLLIWRDYTHSASAFNRAIRLVHQDCQINRWPEYLRGDEVFDVPNGWSYFVDSLEDPNLHEVDYSEYRLGDLLVREDEILVILDVYDDSEDILVFSLSENSTYVENIEDLTSKNWKVISLDDLIL